MSIVFNADEIFALAERIEQNGEAFYRAASALTEDTGRQLLLDLAAWEAGHRECFRKMRRDLRSAARESVTFDPDDEAALYLEALADGVVFQREEDPLASLGEDPDLETILYAALQREKDAIAFFVGMREIVPKHLGKERINEIIREEMSHVLKIKREIGVVKR